MQLWPEALITIANIPAVYGYCVQPVIAWVSLAEQWAAESGTSIDGRYHTNKRQVQSAPSPKRQDTYITGSVNAGSRTGRAFTVVSGTWVDDLYYAAYGAYGIQMGSGVGAGSASEIVSSSTTTDIEDAVIILRRGFSLPEALNSQAYHQRSTTYTYIHLAYQSPDGIDYRIALEYGQPIRLDITYDGGQTWNTGVAIASSLGNIERYLQANNGEIRFHAQVPVDYHSISIEIGDGAYLHHAPIPSLMSPPKLPQQDPSQPPPHLTPTTGNIRVLTQNGSIAFFYLPLRYQGITVNKSWRDYGELLPNAANAYITGNGLTPYNSSQVNNATINTDGQRFSWSVNATVPDAGDGYGGNQAAVLSDATLIIPAVWDTTVPGTPPGYLDGIGSLRGMRVVEMESFDEVTRLATQRLVITNWNGDALYTGSYGNIAVNVAASNGGPYYQRFQGIGGCGKPGVAFTSFPGVGNAVMELYCCDKSYMMQTAINDEINLDGWGLFPAVRFLCEKGNIHPQWLQYVPDLGPYGVADTSYPGYILGRGTGNQPRFRFDPRMSAWSILQELVAKMSDISLTTGLPVPYYMGFDPYGYFHFEPVELASKAVTAIYSDSASIDPNAVDPNLGWNEDPSAPVPILEMTVSNTVDDMRTSLDWMGIDADTYELLYYHLPLPPYVSIAKGFRDTWTERHADFASLDYLQYIATAASIQASIPQQTVTMKVPFRASVHAGDQCIISEGVNLGRTDYFTIKSIQSVYGMSDVSGASNQAGQMECYSIITARAIQNTF